MSRTLTPDDIESLAVGAWILGTGGGGSPYLSLLNLRSLYRDGKRVALIAPGDLDDEALVGIVAGVGAPLVGQERLADSRLAAHAVEVMARHLGEPFAALMSMEIGGSNGLRPLLAAAHLGLPVVDADCMGRAWPEAQMTSLAVGGLAPGPSAAVDPRGLDTIVHAVPDWRWAERVGRQVCVEYGSAATTCRPHRGAEIKAWGIAGTTTRAIALGDAVRAAQSRHDDPVAALLAAEPGRRLFTGKIVDVARRATAGFLRGSARLDGLDADKGTSLRLDFQNEWIVAWRDGTAIAMSPDLICVLDTQSGEAVGTETVRYGQRVSVIALPPAPLFLSEKGLAHVGPRAFGYDLDYRSAFA
ncbi:MAG: DUF917 domain-containing protein [Reyranellaceae bacterium]